MWRANRLAILVCLILAYSACIGWVQGSLLPAFSSELSQLRTRERQLPAISELERDKVRESLKKMYGKDFSDFRQVKTKVGDVATGVVIYEEKDESELDLDAKPCTAVIKVFHKPYKKENLKDTVKCGSQTHTKVLVKQE